MRATSHRRLSFWLVQEFISPYWQTVGSHRTRELAYAQWGALVDADKVARCISPLGSIVAEVALSGDPRFSWVNHLLGARL